MSEQILVASFGIEIVALHCVDQSVTIFKEMTKHLVPKRILM